MIRALINKAGVKGFHEGFTDAELSARSCLHEAE